MARKQTTKNKKPRVKQPQVVTDFSERLLAWRAEQGLPLKHIAQAVGLSVSIISEWEHGNRFPSVINLDALARCMGVPVCSLLYHKHGDCPCAMSGKR